MPEERKLKVIYETRCPCGWEDHRIDDPGESPKCRKCSKLVYYDQVKCTGTGIYTFLSRKEYMETLEL